MVEERRLRSHRRSLRLLLGAGVSVLFAGLLASGASGQEGGWAYELVSPAEKNGYPVFWSPQQTMGLSRLSEDGAAALYTSFGIFAGAESGMPQAYRSVRTPSGWVSRSVTPPTATVVPNPNTLLNYNNFWIMATPSLSAGLLRTRDPLVLGDGTETLDIYKADTSGTPILQSIGNAGERTEGSDSLLEPALISRDGERSYFTSSLHLAPADADRAEGGDTYERWGERTTLLQERSNGTLINRCGSKLGSGLTRGSVTNAVSAFGDRVFFTVPSDDGLIDPDCSQPKQLYMREADGTLTYVSASRLLTPEMPQEAVYQGASQDGSRVFFVSYERLTSASGGGLYIYDVPSDSLRLAVESNDVLVVKIAEDGRSLYFRSSSILAPGGGGGSGLYRWQDDGAGGSIFRWIADDVANDFPVDPVENLREADVSDDGATIAFVSAQTPNGFDNVDVGTGLPTKQVFVDEGDGVRCVSCDVAGQRPSGARVTGNAALARFTGSNTPAGSTMSADGKRVFFVSPDRLVPEDANRQIDVYEYSGGRVRLVSGGRGDEDSYLIEVSDDGETVLFATYDRLVGADRDNGNMDMYVARLGGGFPDPPEPPVARVCTGDPCQGDPTPGPAEESAGSATFSADPADPDPLPRPPARTSLPRQSRAALRSLALGRTALLSVRSTGAGLVRVRLTARLGGRTRIVARGQSRAGSGTRTIKVRVRLSAAARRSLARTGRLVVGVEAVRAGQATPATQRITLRRSSASSTGGRR